MHRIVKIQNEPESLRYDGSNANYPIDGKRRRKFADGCGISGQSLRPKNIRPDKVFSGRVDDMNDIGKIGWFDLTVTDASAIRDFYSKVVGWKSQDVSMGEYQDFNMTMPESGEPAAGICHARGGNAELPSQWLIYITVAGVDKSAELCRENGGAVIVGPKSMGDGKFCVIEDPNGSIAALYQSG